MSPFAIALLAVGMSVDALIASVSRGAAMGRPSFAEAARTGVVFGVVEALTPLIGWGAGVVASQYVQAVDHWVAFALLGAVGGRMFFHALKRSGDAAPSAPSQSFGVLLATAVGTSLDAMAVGVSLAFLQANIVVIALSIGLATALMSTGGMLAGRLIGARFGRYAELAGGLMLVGLGASILFEHLNAA
ncbi:manganese efflux pump MntP family protein [Chenggangzhangella methanolivorans]|uniref:Putative manganese efflux pump MntP n=1 Tax=Chenggangzhangella methanolivorans TaxID=1437009 RepID=A0A9E6UNB7_9HYPH|nr:manganese efflux pump MntP family protein [Chenggangzhangella methanolivorans]QZO00019.1 manganese efflux pump MntP family protein [Chenggangzhangella methanolivorans]